MTCAIIESLDVLEFSRIITNPALHDTKERIDAFGDSPKVLYSWMEKHFKQRARAAQNPDEAGASTTRAQSPTS